MGDDYVRYGFPFIDVDAGGSVLGMIRACESAAKTLPANVKIIPGHGALSNLEELREYIKMLKETSATVSAALRKGKTLEQMKKEHVLAPWSQRYSNQPVTTDVFIETLYNSLSGHTHTPFVKHN